MTSEAWESIRAVLSQKYDDLRRQLVKKLGSEDLASEVLHEAWIRYNRADAMEPVASPAAYIIRTALNIAVDRRRAENRHSIKAELSELLSVPDDGASPEDQAAYARDLQVLRNAVASLPPTQRRVLIASRIDGKTHQAIADELNISKRTVQNELNRALAFCAKYFEGG
jgi:RNA polymerase sigma-70 factor (ECF subfamily)